jgi:hypothetical protein
MEKDWIRHWCNFKFSIIEDLFRSRIPETLQWYNVYCPLPAHVSAFVSV